MRKSAIRQEKTAVAPETMIERLWNVRPLTMGTIVGPDSSTVGHVGLEWLCPMMTEGGSFPRGYENKSGVNGEIPISRIRRIEKSNSQLL
jgi:hypothetical protein